jgi:hypothetical protein
VNVLTPSVDVGSGERGPVAVLGGVSQVFAGRGSLLHEVRLPNTSMHAFLTEGSNFPHMGGLSARLVGHTRLEPLKQFESFLHRSEASLPSSEQCSIGRLPSSDLDRYSGSL